MGKSFSDLAREFERRKFDEYSDRLDAENWDEEESQTHSPVAPGAIRKPIRAVQSEAKQNGEWV